MRKRRNFFSLIHNCSLYCSAIHSLNAYHPYSIPDILRMNNFDITVNVKQVMTM